MINLPDKLYLDSDRKKAIATLYSIFHRDIKQGLMYKNIKVRFDSKVKKGTIYEEAFWHLVTREEDKTDRLLDFKRAKRIPWIKPIVENYKDNSIKKWEGFKKDRDGIKRKREYLWYIEGKYLIVLKPIKDKYYLATAFYVNHDNNEYFTEEYKKAKKRDSSFNRPLDSSYSW